MDTHESLLHKTPLEQGTVLKKYRRIIIGILSLSAVLVLGVLAYSYYLSLSVKDILPTDRQMSAEEKARQAGWNVYNLYTSEGAPEMSSITPALTEKSKNNVAPAGSLLVSGVKTTVANQITQVFSTDVASDSPSFTSLFPESATAMIEFKDILDPKESFVLTTSQYTYERDADKMSIHRLNVVSKELQAYLSVLGTAERSLDWSKTSNLLAFNRLIKNQESYADLVSLSNWELVVFDPATDQILATVGGGYQPKFSPDGRKIMYLKEAGLFVYDLDLKTETQLVSLPEGGKVTGTSMIDLSPDGKYLVWTTAKLGTVTIMEIIDWDTGTLKDVGQMKVEGTEFYWPQFSPDSSHYVVQAIDKLTGVEQERKNPRLEIRALKATEVVKSIPLTEFNFDAFFTDDWVAKMPAL